MRLTRKPADCPPRAFFLSELTGLTMPRIAFSTLACPDWPLERVLESCRRYGYDGVEIRQVAGETDLLKVAELAPVAACRAAADA